MTKEEFIEQINRLVDEGRITKEKLDAWLKDNIITQDEYEYIIGN